MKKLTIIGLMCWLSAIGIVDTTWAADQGNPKTLEQKAWEGVDSLNKESLQDFFKQFPDGELTKRAKVALELQDRFDSIKKGDSKAGFTISKNVLGKDWEIWQEFNPKTGVGGYSLDNKGRLGGLLPDPLGGGKTYSGARIHEFHRLWALMPAGDGSIIAFRTGGLKMELFKGIFFETPGNEPIYFGVIAGKGWVHLRGAGKVTLPNGKTTDLN